MYEFWVVSTRPVAVGGLALSVREASVEVATFRQLYLFLEDRRTLLDLWLALVNRYECKGKPAHDARIVAAMQSHGVSILLTLNPDDFRRYTEITVVDPRDAASIGG